jgi:hypothetical protein
VRRTCPALTEGSCSKLMGPGMKYGSFKTAGISKQPALLNREAELAAVLCHFLQISPVGRCQISDLKHRSTMVML